MYQLAECLHKTLDEIKSMTANEYVGWIAYFKIKKENDK